MQVWRETTKLAAGGGWGVKVLGEEERVAGGGKKKKSGKKAKKVEGKVEEVVEVKTAKVEVEETVVVDLEGPGAPGPTDILITTPLRLIFAIKAKTVDLSSFVMSPLRSFRADSLLAQCTPPDSRRSRQIIRAQLYRTNGRDHLSLLSSRSQERHVQRYDAEFSRRARGVRSSTIYPSHHRSQVRGSLLTPHTV